MKLSYNWLKELIDLPESPEEVARILGALGIEAAAAPNPAGTWKNIVTGKVLETTQHPNADKLRLCTVTDGERNYSVVCGAANVAPGQTIPFAKIGAELPGGMVIKPAKIRGVASEGMICSEEELGLAEESHGIMELPGDTVLGKPLAEALGGIDTVIEVEITTNRPDCLSHVGIARELSAKLGRPLRMPPAPLRPAGEKVSIRIENADLCQRYIGAVITGITVKPSPQWMAERLERCGLRPINNIVDITNYVLLEMGHPLHAFDLERMEGKGVVARTAREGEKILALDGREYALTPSMLVIADEARPQAIAGVMGGEASGVREGTRDILLESALFLPGSIRRTSKALNLSTDSSYRFERGTSWEMAETASWRAIDLILQLAGGTLVERRDEAVKEYHPAEIRLRHARAEKILNLTFTSEEVVSILSGLGMKVRPADGAYDVTVPSWRLDVKQEIDLTEELARHKGYDRITTTVRPIVPSITEGKKPVSFETTVRSSLAASGFNEVLNYSLLSEEALKRFGLPVGHRVANPLSRENEALRTSLLPGLWNNFTLNAGQGFVSVRIFETGTVFTADGEKKALGILASGPVWPEWWGWEAGRIERPAADFYYLSGIVSSLLPGFRMTAGGTSSHYHPGKSARIEVRGKAAGEFGMLRPDLTAGHPYEIGFAEIDLGLIESFGISVEHAYKPIRRQPPVKRDLSFVLGDEVTYDQVASQLNRLKQETSLEDYLLFSVYADPEKLGTGRKSYSFHLVFRHEDHTLTDKEVNEQIAVILKKLQDKLKVSLR